MLRSPLSLSALAALALGCAASAPPLPCGAHVCGPKQLCLQLIPGAPGVPTPPLRGPARPPETKCADALPAPAEYGTCSPPVDRRATCHGAPEPSAPPHP